MGNSDSEKLVEVENGSVIRKKLGGDDESTL